MLQQAKTSPDFTNYLAYILSSPTPPPGLEISSNDYHIVRSSAAIMLKNTIRVDYKSIPQENLSLIKVAVPMAIQDAHSQIRSYAGNICTELIRRGGLLSWPELLPDLFKLLEGEGGQVTGEAQEGAAAAIAKICDDNTKMLERDINGERPLNFLMPKLLATMKNPNPKVRSAVLLAVNAFTSRKTQAIEPFIDPLLANL